MYPKFCLSQDILTKKIIGRGSKRGGLYYMDDFSVGQANITSQSSTKKREIGSGIIDWGTLLFRTRYICFQVCFPT